MLFVSPKGELTFRTRGSPILVLQDSSIGILRLRIDNRFIGLLSNTEVGLYDSLLSAEGFRLHEVVSAQWTVSFESVSHPGKYLRANYRRLILSDDQDKAFELQTSFRFVACQGQIIQKFASSTIGGLSNLLLPTEFCVELAAFEQLNIENRQRAVEQPQSIPDRPVLSCQNCPKATEQIENLKRVHEEYKVQYRILKDKLYTKSKSEEQAIETAKTKSERAEYFETLASQYATELARLKQQLNLSSSLH